MRGLKEDIIGTHIGNHNWALAKLNDGPLGQTVVPCDNLLRWEDRIVYVHYNLLD